MDGERPAVVGLGDPELRKAPAAFRTVVKIASLILAGPLRQTAGSTQAFKPLAWPAKMSKCRCLSRRLRCQAGVGRRHDRIVCLHYRYKRPPRKRGGEEIMITSRRDLIAMMGLAELVSRGLGPKHPNLGLNRRCTRCRHGGAVHRGLRCYV